MTYEDILARTPPSTAAGNQAVAGEFVVFLTSVIEARETFAQFTTSQQRYLYRLRGRWHTRAAGQDARWNEHGSRPGRREGTKKRQSTRRDPGEETPLFQSLMNKYGSPRSE